MINHVPSWTTGCQVVDVVVHPIWGKSGLEYEAVYIGCPGGPEINCEAFTSLEVNPKSDFCFRQPDADCKVMLDTEFRQDVCTVQQCAVVCHSEVFFLIKTHLQFTSLTQHMVHLMNY